MGVSDPSQANLPWVPGPDSAIGSMYGARDRYLSRTVDYRSILGEIICKHLGATAAQIDSIIPGYGNPAEVLRQQDGDGSGTAEDIQRDAFAARRGILQNLSVQVGRLLRIGLEEGPRRELEGDPT